MSKSRINLCGTDIDTFSFEEVVSTVVAHVHHSPTPGYVVTPNAAHIVTLQEDTYFKEIYRDAFLVVPDGVPLLWAAKVLNKSLPERVNGTDLFERLCEVSSKAGFKVFLLGGRPGAAAAAAAILQKRYPNLKIAGTYCPTYGFENDLEELAIISSTIKAAAPDILFVGLGAPKQEKWIYKNYKELNIPISIGIGVSFELVSGMVKRAPRIMQSLGLEWFFRLLMEPRRLWKRYVVGNVVFVWLIIKQKLGFLGKSESC